MPSSITDTIGMALYAFLLLGFGWALVDLLVRIHRNHAKTRRKETALEKVFQRSGRSGRSNSGQGLLEYAMVIVMVAVIVMLILTFLGYNVSEIYREIVEQLPF